MNSTAPDRPFHGTADAIAWHAQHAPDETGIVEMGRRVSYRHCAAAIAHCVRFLESHGIRSGHLVGIEAGLRRYQQLLLFLACEVIGATTTAFSQPDLRRDDPVLPGCDVLLLTSAQADPCHQAVVFVPSDLDADRVGGATAADLARLQRPPDPDRVVRIARTSGSTGRPKAVWYTHATQQRIVLQRYLYLPASHRADIRFLCLQSLSIRAVYTRVYMALQMGGSVLFALEAQAADLLRAGAANAVMLLAGEAEGFVRRIGEPAAAPLLVELIGARASRSLCQLVRERLGAIVHTHYSSNETNTICYTNDDGVGTLCDGVQVRIVDEHGHEQPGGETGLIHVKTATMAGGYWNDPGLTRQTFADGWYRTSDVGFAPESGKLVVLGRADDVLNIGGVKLAPAPIEEEIKQLPGVLDAALLMISTGTGTDTLLVAVELGQAEAAGDLWSRVQPMLSRYVRSFDLLPLPSFPRTETGKVRRADIETAFRRRFG